MTMALELRLGKGRISVPIEHSTVVLCDTVSHAERVAKAFQAAGALLIDGMDAARGTVSDQLGRKRDRDPIDRAIASLQVPEDILDWRPRDLSPLQRMLAASLVAAVAGSDPIVFDVSHIVGSPFDVAHVFGHLRRLRAAFAPDVVAIVADPALISSAGDHLIVLDGDTVAETGLVAECLARPASATLLQRLESTPIASPMAMQLRRVQRASTKPVNYAHTQIITLPTQDSIALAGGDE